MRTLFHSYLFSRGEAFVISIRVNGGQGYPTQFLGSRTEDSLSRAWIFYQNDSGWHAIGKLNFNIWVGMSTGSNFNTVSYPRGWNMLCVPQEVADKRKTVIFPCAGSEAFGYDNGYSVCDTLQSGKGYWIKFDSTCRADFRGTYVFEVSTQVKAGWNLIGTPSIDMTTDNIFTIPDGIISSGFYQYDKGYALTDVFRFGSGYWVKVREDGKIFFFLSASKELPSVKAPNLQLIENMKR